LPRRRDGDAAGQRRRWVFFSSLLMNLIHLGVIELSLFITFEGVEGSGKTTQIQRLKKYLSQKGIHCKVTREPGGARLARK